MRLLAISDLHVDAVTAGLPRRGEVEAFLASVAVAARARDVDLILVGGDYFDPGRMTDCIYAGVMLRAVFDLTAAARLGSIWITGNHDVVDTTTGATTMTPARVAAESAGLARAVVAERPALIRLSGVRVLCLPYPASSRLAAYEAERDAAITEAAVGGGDPLVVLAHLTVPGAVTGSESLEMSRGGDVDFPGDAVAELRPALVLNGHYHRAQTVSYRGLDIHVPGSPCRFTFGEAADPKSYIIAEI